MTNSSSLSGFVFPEGVCLRQASMFGYDLQNASFRKANLMKADLRSARLCNADLSGADLRNAKFDYYLESERIKSVLLEGAIFDDCQIETLFDLWIAGADFGNDKKNVLLRFITQSARLKKYWCDPEMLVTKDDDSDDSDDESAPCKAEVFFTCLFLILIKSIDSLDDRAIVLDTLSQTLLTTGVMVKSDHILKFIHRQIMDLYCLLCLPDPEYKDQFPALFSFHSELLLLCSE